MSMRAHPIKALSHHFALASSSHASTHGRFNAPRSRSLLALRPSLCKDWVASECWHILTATDGRSVRPSVRPISPPLPCVRCGVCLMVCAAALIPQSIVQCCKSGSAVEGGQETCLASTLTCLALPYKPCLELLSMLPPSFLSRP